MLFNFQIENLQLKMLSLYFLLLFSWVGGGGVADFNLKLKSQTGLKTNLRGSRSSLNGFNLERKRDVWKPRLFFSFSHSIFFSRCIKLKEFHLKHKTSRESQLIFQATRNLAFCPPESMHFLFIHCLPATRFLLAGLSVADVHADQLLNCRLATK